MQTRKVKIAMIGYQGCLVTPYSKDRKTNFSSFLLKRLQEGGYNGFIGSTASSVKTVIFNFEHSCMEFRHVFERNMPTSVAASWADMTQHIKSDPSNLYVYKISENLEKISKLPKLAVSCSEEKNCGESFSEIEEIEKTYEESHHFEIPEHHTHQKPKSVSKMQQLINVARFMRAQFPVTDVEVDYFDIKRYAYDVFKIDTKDLLRGVIFNVFVHDNQAKLSSEIASIGKISRKGILNLLPTESYLSGKSIFSPPKKAEPVFLPSPGDVYTLLPAEEFEEKSERKKSCCFC